MNTNQQNNVLSSPNLNSGPSGNILTSTKIVTNILELVPKENELNDNNIKDYSYVVFMNDNNTGFIAPYSNIEPPNSLFKLCVTDLEDVNLKTMKLDKTTWPRRRLVKEPNVKTRYSYKQLMAFHHCYLRNRLNVFFNYPLEPGLYLITECTKKWIKYTPVLDYGDITKVLTIHTLSSYYKNRSRSIAGSSINNSRQPESITNPNADASTVVLLQNRADDLVPVFVPSMRNKPLLKFKDRFITFDEGEYPLNKMSRDEATFILSDVIKHAQDGPFKYYVTMGHHINSRNVALLWVEYFKTQSFTDICPQYTSDERNKYKKNDSFRTAAQNSVMKLLYTVIRNYKHFYLEGDVPDSIKDEVFRFRENWNIFYRTMMALKPQPKETINKIVNSDLNKPEPKNHLNKAESKSSENNHRDNEVLLVPNAVNEPVLPDLPLNLGNSKNIQNNGANNENPLASELNNTTLKNLSEVMELHKSENQKVLALHKSEINKVIADFKNEMRCQSEYFMNTITLLKDELKIKKKKIKKLKRKYTY